MHFDEIKKLTLRKFKLTVQIIKKKKVLMNPMWLTSIYTLSFLPLLACSSNSKPELQVVSWGDLDRDQIEAVTKHTNPICFSSFKKVKVLKAFVVSRKALF